MKDRMCRRLIELLPLPLVHCVHPGVLQAESCCWPELIWLPVWEHQVSVQAALIVDDRHGHFVQDYQALIAIVHTSLPPL